MSRDRDGDGVAKLRKNSKPRSKNSGVSKFDPNAINQNTYKQVIRERSQQLDDLLDSVSDQNLRNTIRQFTDKVSNSAWYMAKGTPPDVVAGNLNERYNVMKTLVDLANNDRSKFNAVAKAIGPFGQYRSQPINYETFTELVNNPNYYKEDPDITRIKNEVIAEKNAAKLKAAKPQVEDPFNQAKAALDADEATPAAKSTAAKSTAAKSTAAKPAAAKSTANWKGKNLLNDRDANALYQQAQKTGKSVEELTKNYLTSTVYNQLGEKGRRAVDKEYGISQKLGPNEGELSATKPSTELGPNEGELSATKPSTELGPNEGELSATKPKRQSLFSRWLQGQQNIYNTPFMTEPNPGVSDARQKNIAKTLANIKY